MVAEPARRLFFALWPDPATAGALHALAQSAHETAGGGRCMRRDTLHMTLAFLGDVDASRLPGMLEIGARVKGRAFRLEVDRLGYWRHNRIVWAGCRGSSGLLDLVGRLRSLLAAAGMRVDSQAFVPHVTLVRNASAEPLSELMAPVVWQVGDFALIESRLSGQGARYETLARWPLDGSIG